jgi:hypothetical protein
LQFQSHFKVVCSLAITAVAFSLISCGGVKFQSAGSSSVDAATVTSPAPAPVLSPTPTPTPTPAPSSASCDPTLQVITRLTKLLFVVDTSGSNYVSDSLGPGTDPDKSLRGGSIQQFFTNYSSKPNFQWGLIYFQQTQAYPLVNGFTQSTAVMQAAIDTFMNVLDQGATPYLAALATASQEIADDPDLHAMTQPQYVVVFLSDGEPSDVADNASGSAQIVSAVQSLVALGPSQITFNAVYYGVADPTASSLMQSMAQAGGGKFLDINANPANKSFQIEDTITVPSLCP